jgi:signal transduction histidine kinase
LTLRPEEWKARAMDLFRWINGSPDAPLAHGVIWPYVTVGLVLLAAVGYAAIAFNWYFQLKLSRAESTSAVRRLRNTAIACGIIGAAFYLSDLSWAAWRVYDAVLLLLVAHTWSFALRMRGPSLVDRQLRQARDLQRTAQRYHEIAELLPNVVWTAGSDGLVDFSNRRWIEYHGSAAPWTHAVHPQEQSEVALWWRQAVRAQETVSREVRLLGADGEYRTFVVRATPIIRGADIRGGDVRWLGACADVEDQKRAIREREEQARQKVFFLNALSHDLRAPLHNVTLNAHLLKMSSAQEAELQVIDTIVENAVAAGEMVTRLLEFARAGEDRSNAERLHVAADVLRPLVSRFQPLAQTRGLSLRLHAPADAEVWVDRQQFERIVSNLIDNAIKFTDRGGITVELLPPPPLAPPSAPAPAPALSAPPLAASASARERKPAVRVRVRDTGIGIPAESVGQVFDEFYQVNNHERDRRKGFGIGLAICRSLARQFGGDVRLIDTSPDGSCFEVLVPAAGGASRGAGSVSTSAGGAGSARDVASDGISGVLDAGTDRPRERAGGGGRPDGPPGHHVDPEAAGLCGV